MCRLRRKNLEYMVAGIFMICMPLNIFYLMTVALTQNVKQSVTKEEALSTETGKVIHIID